jgi:hypothetical protein
MSRMGIRHLHDRAGARLRLLAAAGAGACLLAAGTAALVPGAAQASSSAFTVNTTADTHDAHPGDGSGGGIAAQDTATLTGSRVTGNTAGAAIGGGVFNVGTVTDSTISGNTADSGGGVEDYPGLLMTITDATLDGNYAAADGGALDINQQITVTDSTIAGNKAGDSFFKGRGLPPNWRAGR